MRKLIPFFLLSVLCGGCSVPFIGRNTCKVTPQKPAGVVTTVTATTVQERIVTVVQKVQDDTGWLVTIGIIVMAGGVVMLALSMRLFGGAALAGGAVLVGVPILLPVLAQEFMGWMVWIARVVLVLVILIVVYKYRRGIAEIAQGIDEVIKPALGKRKDEVMSRLVQSDATKALVKMARLKPKETKHDDVVKKHDDVVNTAVQPKT